VKIEANEYLFLSFYSCVCDCIYVYARFMSILYYYYYYYYCFVPFCMQHN